MTTEPVCGNIAGRVEWWCSASAWAGNGKGPGVALATLRACSKVTVTRPTITRAAPISWMRPVGRTPDANFSRNNETRGLGRHYFGVRLQTEKYAVSDCIPLIAQALHKQSEGCAHGREDTT